MGRRALGEIFQEAKGKTGEELAALVYELVSEYPELHQQSVLFAGNTVGLSGRDGLENALNQRHLLAISTNDHGAHLCRTRACMVGWTNALHIGVVKGRRTAAGRIMVSESERLIRQYFTPAEIESMSENIESEDAALAAKLLGVDPDVFVPDVYNNMSDTDAMERFALLTGVKTEEENV